MFFGSDKIYVDPLLLEDHNLYFRKLDVPEKERFVKRLENFISGKEFQGREGLEMTDEIKICISSAAIQLTFGLEEYLLPRFDTVIVYPSIYFSKQSNAYHKGEASAAGAIVFAWDYFKEGFSSNHDRINLGLHEWAHALMISGFFEDSGSDSHFKQYFNKWRMEAQDEFEDIAALSDVFREYGGTSMPEFFAICIEVFFEDPNGFKAKAPSLFDHLCILLNQFPFGKPEQTQENLGKIKLVITPEKSQLAAITLFMLGGVILSVAAGYGFGSIHLVVVACSFIAWLYFRSLYDELFYRNQLAISGNHISVRSPNNKVLGDFFFSDLTSVHVRKRTARDQLYFSYLQDGKIEEKNYSFSYNEEKLYALRKVLQGHKIPFTISKEK